MRKISFICSFVALGLVAVGCGDDDVTPMTDAGPADLGPADLGTRDMYVPPPVDLGPSDPCVAADSTEAAATFDCNGAPTGPGAANDMFGTCTEDADPTTNPQGSCTAGDACFGPAAGSASLAFCISFCTGPGGNYAQTGGCPTGSRCLTVFGSDTDGLCIPSCETDSDCASGYCDPTDNSCYFVAPVDGGVPDDAGTLPDAGTATDAGPNDAGTADDGGPADAGPAGDAA